MNQEERINSRAYWQARFSGGDWDKFDGDGQTVFFAQSAVDAFPEWLKKELLENERTLVDLGCAEGGGAGLLAFRFPLCRVTGVDFSEAAIAAAGKKYPNCSFQVGDILQAVPEADVLFCSNVLEHLEDPAKVLRSILRAAGRHAVIVIPFRDTLGHAEHFRSFDEHFFPLKAEGFHLSYFRIVDCGRRQSPYWPGQQLIAVYSDDRLYPQEEMRLSDLFDNGEYDEAMRLLSSERSSGEAQRAQLAQAGEREAELRRIAAETDGQMADLQRRLDAELSHTAELRKELEALRERMSQREEAAREAAMEAAQTAERAAQQAERAEEKEKELKALLAKSEERAGALDAAASKELDTRLALIREAQEVQSRVLRVCMELLGSRAMRAAHLLSRWHYQRRSDDPKERRAFWRWFRTRFIGKTPDNDHRFNPLFQIINPLRACESTLSGFLTAAEAGRSAAPQPVTEPAPESAGAEKGADLPACACLEEDYRKYDVLVFSVIDYDFRYQRPQQIADHFAREGHRVYYLNANFQGERLHVEKRKGTLHLVTLPNALHTAVYSTDFSDAGVDLPACLDELMIREGIRDALMIADYPTWFAGVRYLKEKYGFALVTDYMDDYTGFRDTANSRLEQACISLLEASDVVAASSSYLARSAEKYNRRVATVRNGTEFAHFHRAFGRERRGKTIGYYGAIAHWFDWGKIRYLSQRFPEAEIVLIGAVTDWEKELKKLPNVRLLGEKPYGELPEHLASFDVCLIPFDASTSLIQATNPVKFYEYLSAGKKVVATEIPELEPFRDRYVYLANEDETFGDYVALCLEGKDSLASPEECAAFARENDWSCRVAQFSEAAESAFPLVSIIVLCYNQLEYTRQCVESILSKTAYPNYELILVDNASTDGTAAYLRELDAREEKVHIVLNGENRGFAGGNNDGLALAKGSLLLLLNNDTVVTRGWLTGMVKRFRDRTVGVVGPVTNSIGDEAMINLGYRKNVARMPALAYAYTAAHMGEDFPNSGTLAMFCYMFSREVLETVGPLDEGYGIGMFEDDDYCAAVRRAGYGIVLAEDVFVHHYGSVSFKKLEDATYRQLFEKNKARFESKWGQKWKMHQYRPGVVPEE